MCKCKYVTLKSSRPTAKMRRRHLATVREDPERKLCKSDFAVYSMVTATAVLSYANSLHGDFVHDDIPAIVTNGDVIGSSPLKQLFLNDFWGAPMSDYNSHKSYRPLTTLSFRLNHALWGSRPWWWHACNVLLHAACCGLVARACRTVARLRRPFAALAALLFAVHPVHTEAVAGVVGRADVLACIFFLSSLLVYHRPSGSKKYVWLSITLGALSMLAKETGITILFFNVIFDIYRCWPSIKRSLYSSRIEKRNCGLTGRIVKVLISLAFLIFLRLALLQGSLPTFSAQDNPAAFHPSFVVRLMTFCYLAAFNWWLLLCPWPLSHDWQLGSVPLLTSVWDPRNLLTCAAFGALLLLCYRCYSDIEIQRHTPLVVGVLLLVLPYIPASNLFVTVGFVIAERVLYLPSVGGVIITAYGVQLMWYWRPGAKVFIVFGLLVLAVSGVARTHKRNADWRDRATLLRADLATLPQNAKLHYNFANFLRESEHQEGAIKHYKEALRLWPTYASAHNNLGTLVAENDNAEYHFLQAIKFNRYHLNAHYNLGKLYKKSGKFTEAMNMFDECVWLEPRFVQAYVELLAMKPEGEKHGLLKRLVELEPNNWEHYVLYGNWLRTKALPAAASKFYVQAVQLSFQHRNLINKPLRGDLIAIRSTALVLRDLGQKSRILQLLIRWHTWRRGTPSAAAHVYLREWRLRVELAGRAQAYSQASSHPVRTRRCFDHSQLTVASKLPEEGKRTSQEEKHESNGMSGVTIDGVKQVRNNHAEKSHCCGSNCGTKKRTVSVSTQIKMTHNKSEIGLKNKKCALHRKQRNNSIKSSDLIIAPPLAEHIFIKTF